MRGRVAGVELDRAPVRRDDVDRRREAGGPTLTSPGGGYNISSEARPRGARDHLWWI
jgi:hypothetical protein